jgi:penicillin-binding protein 1A
MTKKNFFFLLIVFILAGAFIGAFLGYFRDLPQIKQLETYQPSTITKIYSDNDELIAELFQENRVLIPLAKIPKILKEAVVAVEDSRFYEHHGIDTKGILRAFWSNLRAGRIVEGGSTLTQQLSKVLFLTPEKTLSRKIKEAFLAMQIERQYSKDKILEMYLNQIYLGSGAYGVEAAARTYFGKSVSDLNIPEAAMIAGLPKAPSFYSPLNNIERAKKRRDHVLERLAKRGYITKEELDKALATPVQLNPPKIKRRKYLYFIEHVRQNLENKYGNAAIYKAGLNIYLTVNSEMQEYAEKALKEGLRNLDKTQGFRPIKRDKGPADFHEFVQVFQRGSIIHGQVTAVKSDSLLLNIGDFKGRILLKNMEWAKIKNPLSEFRTGDVLLAKILRIYEKGAIKYELALEQEPEVQGALIAIQPDTGAIKAMVGGYDFEKSEFNRATQAKRQAGSAFKPFIYSAALDNGYTAADIIIDAPVIYKDPSKEGDWKPRNFSNRFYGPITLRSALEHSRNVATIRLLEKVGVNTVIEYAHKMGIKSTLQPYLSLGLGAFEVTPLELTAAYGVFANKGIRVEPYTIRTVTDIDGKLLEENRPIVQDVLRPENAFLVTNLLEGVVENGTGWRAKALERPAAAKTGTTNDFRDAWFIGYVPHLVAGVWVGYDDNRSLGENETGSRAAGPIWVDFMQNTLKKKPVEKFPVPENIVFVRINPETGKVPAEDKEGGPTIMEAFIKGTEPETGGEDIR